MIDLFTSRDIKKASAPEPAHAVPESEDALLACLVHVAGERGVRVSAATLLDGMGLGGESLTPAQLPAICTRVGLSTRHLHSNSDIPAHLLPAIVLTQGRGAWVVYAMTKDHVSLFVPGHEGRMRLPRAQFDATVTGDVIAVMASDDAHDMSRARGKPYQGSWFWSVIKQMRGQYLKVVLASFLVNSLAIAAPLFTLNVYDRVLPNASYSTLWVLAVGMGLVLVFDLAFRALRGAIIDSTGRWADIKLGSRVFDHVLRMRMGDRPARAGEFANRLRDFETVRDFFSSATVLAVVDIAFVSLFLFVIYLVGGPMVWLPAIGVVVVLLVGLIAQPLMMRSVREVQEEAALKHGLLIEAINGLSTIKAQNAENVFLKRWQALVARTARSTERVRGVSLNLINVTLVVQQAVTVGLIIYGTYLFDAGLISMGGIIATVMLASRAVGPLGTVAGTFSRLQQSLVSLRNLNDIMDGELENADSSESVSRSITRGDIVFDSVSFTYPDTEVASLKEASFRFRAGQRVGVIGKVGAGKSTLAQLVAGLYPPSEGVVSVDGINLAQLHTTDLRAGLGYVEQDITLFSGSVRDNIAFGNPHASDAAIVKAAELAGASEFIDASPLGYGMPVGERGNRLSGGQRQFVALARALLRDPAILLLDEPTAAMDTVSEAQFLGRLDAASRGKTLIISTHRQSLLALVDTLLVLDEGRVLAFGPKDEVMALLVAKAHKGEVQARDDKVVPLKGSAQERASAPTEGVQA